VVFTPAGIEKSIPLGVSISAGNRKSIPVKPFAINHSF